MRALGYAAAGALVLALLATVARPGRSLAKSPWCSTRLGGTPRSFLNCA